MRPRGVRRVASQSLRDAAVYNALLSAYTRGELINAAAEKLFEEIPVNIMWFFGPRWFRATPRMGSTRKRTWEKKGVLPNELTVRTEKKGGFF
jgi:hypothetical protein